MRSERGNNRGMATRAPKSRLSIGFYDDRERLRSTVGRLFERGFSRDQLGIVTLRKTIAALIEPATSEHTDWKLVSRLLDELLPLDSAPGLGEIVVSRGPIHRILAHQVKLPSPEVLTAPASAGTSDFASVLQQGAMALAVASETSEQQWASTRILLEHSAHPVQTHEFSLKRPG